VQSVQSDIFLFFFSLAKICAFRAEARAVGSGEVFFVFDQGDEVGEGSLVFDVKD